MPDENRQARIRAAGEPWRWPMRVTHLYLRHYRVYEELDLDIPPGLVGIYGPNGSGKSTLLEAFLWALWGVARTSKDEVRTSGVNTDCVAELEFEHEGHLYLVRRTLSGAASTARAEAWADGAQVTEGVRDTGRYVHSVLGVDDDAFRASVFAEQRQLAAFSERRPEQRRDLVLGLLGITPLDKARDQARRDARARREEVDRLRGLLADVGHLEEELAAHSREVEEAGGRAEEEAKAAAAAAEEQARAEAERDRLDELGRRYERLVEEGKRAKQELEKTKGRWELLAQEDRELAGEEERLATLGPPGAGLEEMEAALPLVDAVLAAARELGPAARAVPAPPAGPDEEAARRAARRAELARQSVAELEGRIGSARAARQRAEEAVAKAAGLSGEASCPLCGQALGAAFEEVQAHRASELAEAEAELGALVGQLGGARQQSGEAERLAAAALSALEEAMGRQAAYESARQRRDDARQRLDRAVSAATAANLASMAAAKLDYLGLPPGAFDLELDQLVDRLSGYRADLAGDLARGRAAAAEAARIRGRLERRPAVREELEDLARRMEELQDQMEELREEVCQLGFRPRDLEGAREAYLLAREAAGRAVSAAQEAQLGLARAQAALQGAEARLEQAREQHRRLGDLADEARHLGRTAELLGKFRNSVVATVGPRLSAQAGELFAELTDHEYDQLEVDPETYEIQIRDQGTSYGMRRFSGSETDLANLALRVAISEQVRFQSGGAVGLLVLDEVFGPLDDERKERMLLALERLRGRFRQVLVVTHASDIKEQLPNAIEVVKLPGRRATARVL
jgi:exonuclease SbcC